jgi:DNA repair exonuclease SbcCD ATPase subunit
VIALRSVKWDVAFLAERIPSDQLCIWSDLRSDVIDLAEALERSKSDADKLRRMLQRDNTNLVLKNRDLDRSSASQSDEIAALRAEVNHLEDQLEKANNQIEMLAEENADLRCGREITYHIGVELED